MGLFDFLGGKKQDKPVSADEVNNLLDSIELIPGLSIPRALANHWNDIEKTKLSFIHIDACPSDDLIIDQSKFGHYPCMPLSFEYPLDSNGKPMFHLAQLNCKELPALEGFPKSGYLQFFISAFDDLYGLDFDNPQSQKDFRVLFFEEGEVENHKFDFSFLDDAMASDMLPVYKPHSLAFTAKEEYVGIGDLRQEESKVFNLDKTLKNYPSIQSELESQAYDVFSPNGHKIGGYAFFTQTDPRDYGGKFENYILLLQIDTDDEIMWGDSGVANFFIHPDDLAKKDFSKVLYNWDCC